MIKAIFFDFDGVIAESVDIKTEAFAKLFEKEGKKIVEKVVDYHLSNTGVSRFEKFRYIYKEILKRSLGNDEFQNLCSKFANLVAEEVVRSPYVKGAVEILEYCSSRFKCYIVSATPQEEIELIIKRRNIYHFFKAVYGAPTKKADAVREIIQKEVIDPAKAVYIGDGLSDYMAAKDNNVIFIARINNNESIFTNTECLKIKDLTNLRNIIEDIIT